MFSVIDDLSRIDHYFIECDECGFERSVSKEYRPERDNGFEYDELELHTIEK